MASNIPNDDSKPWQRTTDPERLRHHRKYTKSAHTKARTSLMDAIATGDDQAIELARCKLVATYTDVDQCHQLYLRYATFTPNALAEQGRWLDEIGAAHMEAVRALDEFNAPYRNDAQAYQKSLASSRRSSQRSTAASLRARLLDAERAVREAELKQQQDKVEADRRAEEERILRDIERARRERAEANDLERKRQSRDLILTHLQEEEESISIHSWLHRPPSRTSTGSSSLHLSFGSKPAGNDPMATFVPEAPTGEDPPPSYTSLVMAEQPPPFFSASPMFNGPAPTAAATKDPLATQPQSFFIPFDTPHLSLPLGRARPPPGDHQSESSNWIPPWLQSRNPYRSVEFPPSTTVATTMPTYSDLGARPRVLFRAVSPPPPSGQRPAIITTTNVYGLPPTPPPAAHVFQPIQRPAIQPQGPAAQPIRPGFVPCQRPQGPVHHVTQQSNVHQPVASPPRAPPEPAMHRSVPPRAPPEPATRPMPLRAPPEPVAQPRPPPGPFGNTAPTFGTVFHETPDNSSTGATASNHSRSASPFQPATHGPAGHQQVQQPVYPMPSSQHGPAIAPGFFAQHSRPGPHHTTPLMGHPYGSQTYPPAGHHSSFATPYHPTGPSTWTAAAQPFTPVHPPPAPAAYSPDSWIAGLGFPGVPSAAPFSGSNRLRPPKPNLVTFSGKARDWPAFIQGFRVQVHDTCSEDWERQTHLRSCLPKQLQDSLCEYLTNPGLYNHALTELQRRFGNRQSIIRSCVELINQLEPIKERNSSSLMSFSASLRSIVATFKLCGYQEELQSYSTLSVLVDKLPREMRSKWAELQWTLQTTGRIPSITEFDGWLDNLAMAEFSLNEGRIQQHASGGSSKQQGPKDAKSNSKSGKGVYAATITPAPPAAPTVPPVRSAPSTTTCPCCSGAHKLPVCKRFKSLQVEKRADVIRNNPCCLRCLNAGHFGSTCEAPVPCTADGCKERHHPLLHGAPRIFPKQNRKDKPGRRKVSFSPDVDKNSKGPPSDDSSSVVSCMVHRTRRMGSMLPIVSVVLKANGVTINGRALLDPGSEVTLLTDDTARQLKLVGPVQSTNITTVTGTASANHSIVNFSVSSVDGGSSFDLQDVLTVKTLNLKSSPVDLDRLKRKWVHLAEVKLDEHQPQDVCLLIGMDHPAANAFIDCRFDPANPRSPRAIKTPFGWCVVGPLSKDRDKPYRCFRTSIAAAEDDQFEELVNTFIRADDFGAKPNVIPPVTADVKRAIEILERTVKHNGERYEAGLLHRDEPPTLVNNREGALRRFFNLEARLLKDPYLLPIYAAGIEAYIQNGHASKLSNEEAAIEPPGRTNYLPHHPVEYPNKPGKYRIVFDGSFVTKKTSLNLKLLPGPDLMLSLVGCVLRFCLYQHGIIGDIKAMFLQVLALPPDRDALRFFWRHPGSAGKPDIYRMNVMIFGAVSSPTTCAYVLRQAAKDFGDCSILNEVLRHIYVDNWLRSYRTKSEAIDGGLSLHAALEKAGFVMTQFASNDSEILHAMPGTRRTSPSVSLDFDSVTSEPTMGMSWNFRSDCFILKVSDRNLKGNTKRALLRAVASIFDPLGHIACVLITAKILLQDVWRAKLDWDTPLPDDLQDRWQRWCFSLSQLDSLTIPRCFTPKRDPPTHQELHIFSDASSTAYGSIAFLVSRYPDGTVIVAFLIAKVRVAPVKFTTIPKLELNAFVISVRLLLVILTELAELNIPPELIFLWTDSTTVIRQINSSHRSRQPVYVANRVSEILEVIDPKQVLYVPTADNPADDVSRGLDASLLSAKHRFFTGGTILNGPRSAWPASPIFPPDDEEPEPEWVGNIVAKPLKPLDVPRTGLDGFVFHSSDFGKVKRVVAYVLRWIHNARHKDLRKDGPLSVDELQAALDSLIRRAQQLEFSGELRCISAGRPIDKRSSIAQLTPFLDERGLLCVGGRLDKAPLPFGARHPVLLPPKAHITELIVWQHHRDNAHASVEATLHKLRQAYWITRGVQNVKRIISSCYRCALFRARTITPMMADLPSFRLGFRKAAFDSTGVDLFGPYSVKIGRSQHKRWVCIFTCATTRAVHLEVVKSLSTDSFINAMHRFEALRGRPSAYWSDNGTNFVGARRELAEIWASIDTDRLGSHLRNRGADWHFNPPSAPHMGGIWEALVRSAKRALHFVLDSRTLDDETFTTAIVHITGLLNSRPLTVLNNDPASPEALTPNHLLLGRANPTALPTTFDERDLSSRKRWYQAQAIAQLFWDRWLEMYAPTLIERRKWATGDRNLVVGDVVAIMDRRNARDQWQIGRISRVITATDGVVRSAWILIPKPGCQPGDPDGLSELHRPAVRLALLEPCEDPATEEGRE